MEVQLSLKAALPLAGILATASDRCSKTGPRFPILTTTFFWATSFRLRQPCSLATTGGCCLVYYNDVIMSAMASQITSLAIVYSTIYSVTDQKKISKLRVIGFGRGIHRSQGNAPHKGPVTRKMFPFDDGIMIFSCNSCPSICPLSALLNKIGLDDFGKIFNRL